MSAIKKKDYGMVQNFLEHYDSFEEFQDAEIDRDDALVFIVIDGCLYLDSRFEIVPKKK